MGAIPFKMYIHVPSQEVLFLGDVYGISEQIKKVGADTSLYRLLKDYNIVTGGLSQCLSLSPLEIK